MIAQKRALMLVWILLMATDTDAVAWTTSEDVLTQAPFQRVSAEQAKQLVARVPRSQIANYLGDKHIGWHIHHGDLVIEGPFDNSDSLIVDGSLTIKGDYDDYGKGIGLLVVFGSLKVGTVMSWGSIYVGGDVDSSGVVYTHYNDYTFEVVGKVNARGIVVDDKSSDYTAGKVDFELSSEAGLRERGTDMALRMLVPELFDVGELEYTPEWGFDAMPDSDTAHKRVRGGQRLLRRRPAPASMIEALKLAMRSGLDEAQRVPLIGVDPLVRRVLAAQPDLQPAVRKALLAADAQRPVAASASDAGE